MSDSHQLRPTYVGIGAQKCASSWLHSILAEHPEVAVPKVKELDFFSYRYDHGYQWYEQCFRTAKPARARGEISPSYFCEPSAPERIARYLPEAKILLSLRDPVERALSNHRHEVRVGHLTGPDLSFETGLANNPMYVEQGLYATHLKNWLRHFPRADILIVLMEDIAADPQAVSKSVYRFLGVDDGYVPAGLATRYNRSFATRWSTLGGVKDTVYGATRLPGLRWLWDVGARAGLRFLYRGINNVPSGSVIPQPNAQTLLQLRQRFAPEIRELQTMIGRSLATWL
ncbi:MAG TPA: sulfotransferase [Steroidobacteraceae bacterium]|nr:sulfotransferase [Steroidobacteraceae bacterium]